MAGQTSVRQQGPRGRLQISTRFKLSSQRWTASFSCFLSSAASCFTASLSSSTSESVCLYHQMESAFSDAAHVCRFSKNPDKVLKVSSVFRMSARLMMPSKHHDVVGENLNSFLHGSITSVFTLAHRLRASRQRKELARRACPGETEG